MEEGWYLMSTEDLERELARWRDPKASAPASNALRLSIDDALAYRNAGNIPDEMDRSLRLVLRIDEPSQLSYLQAKRLMWEPDFHDAPDWRREGSRHVNVVPLRTPEMAAPAPAPWWEDPKLKKLEREWKSGGRVAGIVVPGAYRGFVYKTVLALQEAGVEVTVDNVCGSIERWLPAGDAGRLRHALEEANA
jgi:hypothetical protein